MRAGYQQNESAAIIGRMREIIQSLGGPTEVARYFGVRSQAVSLWCAAGQVPLDRVPGLLRLARERGVALSASDLRDDVDWQAVCECPEVKE